MPQPKRHDWDHPVALREARDAVAGVDHLGDRLVADRGVPAGTSGMSSTMWMSLPQIVDRRVRTSACPGPGEGMSII